MEMSPLHISAMLLLTEMVLTWVAGFQIYLFRQVSTARRETLELRIEMAIRALADCGYVGFWRVLNAQYFGVPQQRRRVFLVAGYRQMPPIQLLADAAPVDAISPASQSQRWPRPADAWAANTLLANKAGSQIAMGCTTFVAEPDGWDQMVERQRTAENDGLCLGLDAANLAEAFSAGNAVVTQVAEWVGRGLISCSHCCLIDQPQID